MRERDVADAAPRELRDVRGDRLLRAPQVEAALDAVDESHAAGGLRLVEVGGGLDHEVTRAIRVDPLELVLHELEVVDQVGEIPLLGGRLRQLVEVDLGKGLEQDRETNRT